MAASNKPTGLIVTCIVFFLIAAICGGGWYSVTNEYRERQAVMAKAGTDLSDEKKARALLETDIVELKDVIGHKVAVVGSKETGGDGTVIGETQKNIAAANGQGGSAKTIVEAVAALGDSNRKHEAELILKDTAIGSTRREIEALKDKYQKDVDTAQAEKDTAVKDKQAALKSKAEEVSSKQAQVDKLSKELKAREAEFEDAKVAWVNERKKFESEVEQYNGQIDKLRDRLKNLTRVSFEQPDGFIRGVDNSSRTVSINLGSADGLKVRTTFSVYKKDNNGVGRGAEDIKAQIEVTRIGGAHQAEAKIVSDDIYKPITKGDPIYTPLWSPGIHESFAIVGLVDLDRDGIMDRDRFHDIVTSSGASLSHEVLDDGKRVIYQHYPEEWVEWAEGGPQMSSQTKYLIIADIPDPSQAVQKDEKEKREQIAGQLKAMREEAKRLGIEEIRMNDFLAYIGYKPERSLFIPGATERPWNLKAGAASSGTSETVGDRSSGGSVSGLYMQSKKLKPQSGNNSGSK